jgi:hypothetical protein
MGGTSRNGLAQLLQAGKHTEHTKHAKHTLTGLENPSPLSRGYHPKQESVDATEAPHCTYVVGGGPRKGYLFTVHRVQSQNGGYTRPG